MNSEAAQTVLLLGEESQNRELLIDLLKERGCQVIKAPSGDEGEAALKARPGVVIVDQRLRGTNGVAWIRKMRDNGHTMPVVFCSASNCTARTFNILRNLLKVDLIVRKPLMPFILVNQIHSLLPVAGGSNMSLIDSEKEEVLQFDPPSGAEAEAPAWKKEYIEERETRQALADLGREYLGEMPETLYELRAQICKSLREEDESCRKTLLTLATTTVHQIKGTAGSLGFSELSRLAGDIESKLRRAQSENPLPEPQIMAQALMVVAEIETWLETWQDDNQSHQFRDLKSGTSTETDSQPGVDAVAAAQTLRVFVVDNDKGRMEQLTAVFDSHGSWIIESPAGVVQVMAALEANTPHLLLLDEDGGAISGYDMCRMIRCHPKWQNLPILIMAGDTSLQTRRNIFDCGADDFIVKPLHDREILLRLTALFTACRRQDHT